MCDYNLQHAFTNSQAESAVEEAAFLYSENGTVTMKSSHFACLNSVFICT